MSLHDFHNAYKALIATNSKQSSIQSLAGVTPIKKRGVVQNKSNLLLKNHFLNM
jgi:hypothetical protein